MKPVEPTSLLLFVALLPLTMVAIGCFLKFSIVLSLLGRAIGGRTLPGTVIVGASLLMVAFVLAPIGDKVTSGGLASSGDAVRAFLEKRAPADTRHELYELQLGLRDDKTTASDHDLTVLAPAFALSELKAAFRVGFFLLLPFLVIDLLLAVVLLALGMHTIEARVISLPLKLLLFLAVDGWGLIVHGLLASYT